MLLPDDREWRCRCRSTDRQRQRVDADVFARHFFVSVGTSENNEYQSMKKGTEIRMLHRLLAKF